MYFVVLVICKDNELKMVVSTKLCVFPLILHTSSPHKAFQETLSRPCLPDPAADIRVSFSLPCTLPVRHRVVVATPSADASWLQETQQEASGWTVRKWTSLEGLRSMFSPPNRWDLKSSTVGTRRQIDCKMILIYLKSIWFVVIQLLKDAHFEAVWLCECLFARR